MKRNNEGGCACVQTGDMLEISISFPQFFCDSKTVLKKNGVRNKNRGILLYIIWAIHIWILVIFKHRDFVLKFK